MTIEQLIFVLLLTAFLIYQSIESVRKKKFALFTFTFFTLFYTVLRNIQLLSGNYIHFAILNKNINFFDNKDIINLLIYVTISYCTFLLSYKILFYLKKTNKETFLFKQYHKINFKHILLFLVAILLFPLNELLSLGYIVYFAALMILKHSKNRLIITIIVFASILLFSITSDRRNWLVLLLTLIFIYFSIKRNVNLFKIASITLLSSIVISYILISYRTEGLFNFTATFERIFKTDNIISVFEIEADFPIVSDDLLIIYHNMTKGNTQPLYGVNFFKPIYSFIPREMWPEKPITISKLFSKNFNFDFYSANGSEPITIYGELLWNFGLEISLFFFIILGLFCSIIDKKIIQAINNYNYNNLAKYASISALSFLIYRGPFDTFWIVYFCFFIFMMFENITVKFKKG